MKEKFSVISSQLSELHPLHNLKPCHSGLSEAKTRCKRLKGVEESAFNEAQVKADSSISLRGIYPEQSRGTRNDIKNFSVKQLSVKEQNLKLITYNL